MLRTGRGLTGALLVAVVILAGLLAPVLARFPPTTQLTGPALAGPSAAHLLGTDEFGRDLWSRVLYGIRVDTIVGLIGVGVSSVLGTCLGLVASLKGSVDIVVTRIFDVILAFPALLLGLGVAAILTPGEKAIICAVVVTNVPFFGRLARTSVRQQQVREYAVAARVLGDSPSRVLFRHILPNILDPLVVQVTLSMATAIYIEGGMSFIGIGIQEPTPSLGNILNGSLNYLSSHANYALGPLVAVSLLMLGLYLLADALNRELVQR